jgi:hypothetical protein
MFGYLMPMLFMRSSQTLTRRGLLKGGATTDRL